MWELPYICQVLRPKSRRHFYCDLSFLKQRNEFILFLKAEVTPVQLEHLMEVTRMG